MPETVLYSLEDLSRILRVSTEALKKEIEMGKLKAKKFGLTYYVPESYLMAFLDKKKKEPNKGNSNNDC